MNLINLDFGFTVTILTKNSEAYLQKVLEALSSFDEILILDNGSQDHTEQIAKQFPNTVFYSSEFLGFGPLHNKAASLAKHDWILSIDSDEIVSPQLSKEILALSLDPKVVYSFPRLNFFRGKQIKWCGWYPERVTRLYHKKSTQFSEDYVHEKVIRGNLLEVKLKNPVHHYPYKTISDFIAKMQHYSTLFAEQNKGKKRASLPIALVHAKFAFFKSYILKLGFLGGFEGFFISLYNSHTAFYKYIKLYEKNYD